MNDPLDEAASGLIEEALVRGNAVRVRVTGRSMQPFLNGGEVVRIEPMSGPLAVGDLVLFRDPQKTQLVMHRVLWARAVGPIRTKGDGVRSLDAPVGRADILGRVSRIERPDGAIELRTPSHRRQAVRIAVRGLLRVALRKFARI